MSDKTIDLTNENDNVVVYNVLKILGKTKKNVQRAQNRVPVRKQQIKPKHRLTIGQLSLEHDLIEEGDIILMPSPSEVRRNKFPSDRKNQSDDDDVICLSDQSEIELDHRINKILRQPAQRKLSSQLKAVRTKSVSNRQSQLVPAQPPIVLNSQFASQVQHGSFQGKTGMVPLVNAVSQVQSKSINQVTPVNNTKKGSNQNSTTSITKSLPTSKMHTHYKPEDKSDILSTLRFATIKPTVQRSQNEAPFTKVTNQVNIQEIQSITPTVALTRNMLESPKSIITCGEKTVKPTKLTVESNILIRPALMKQKLQNLLKETDPKTVAGVDKQTPQKSVAQSPTKARLNLEEIKAKANARNVSRETVFDAVRTVSNLYPTNSKNSKKGLDNNSPKKLSVKVHAVHTSQLRPMQPAPGCIETPIVVPAQSIKVVENTPISKTSFNRGSSSLNQEQNILQRKFPLLRNPFNGQIIKNKALQKRFAIVFDSGLPLAEVTQKSSVTVSHSSTDEARAIYVLCPINVQGKTSNISNNILKKDLKKVNDLEEVPPLIRISTPMAPHVEKESEPDVTPQVEIEKEKREPELEPEVIPHVEIENESESEPEPEVVKEIERELEPEPEVTPQVEIENETEFESEPEVAPQVEKENESESEPEVFFIPDPPATITPVDITKLLYPPKRPRLTGRCQSKFVEQKGFYFRGFDSIEMQKPLCSEVLTKTIRKEYTKIRNLKREMKARDESNFVDCSTALSCYLPETENVKIEEDEIEEDVIMVEDDEEDVLPSLGQVLSKLSTEAFHVKNATTKKQPSRMSRTEEALELIKKGLEMIHNISRENTEDSNQSGPAPKKRRGKRKSETNTVVAPKKRRTRQKKNTEDDEQITKKNTIAKKGSQENKKKISIKDTIKNTRGRKNQTEDDDLLVVKRVTFVRQRKKQEIGKNKK